MVQSDPCIKDIMMHLFSHLAGRNQGWVVYIYPASLVRRSDCVDEFLCQTLATIT